MPDVACGLCKHYDADNRKCTHPDRDDTTCIFYYGYHKASDYCQLFTPKTADVREVEDGTGETV